MKPQILQNFSNTIHKLPSPANTSTQPNENTGRHAAEPSAINTGLFCGLFSRKHLSKEERDNIQWEKTKKNFLKQNIKQHHATMKRKEEIEKKLNAHYDKEYKKWLRNQPKKYNFK
ncbi:hypothetical protein KQH60_09655 [Mycetohabitans sp. B8]|uniref:hypothetical protein n=1 Tax=Mycetohabitans sp. B8 TaxID=2841845 RepID=UPI001F336672|nr:hypothetical protein [Mycetohabitans sp. B8]MCG1042787.1 hypothetical protein [Mycetohabitans sp. B8]